MTSGDRIFWTFGWSLHPDYTFKRCLTKFFFLENFHIFRTTRFFIYVPLLRCWIILVVFHQCYVFDWICKFLVSSIILPGEFFLTLSRPLSTHQNKSNKYFNSNLYLCKKMLYRLYYSKSVKVFGYLKKEIKYSFCSFWWHLLVINSILRFTIFEKYL